MSEATETIVDIQEALAEYGSSIIIKKSVNEVRDAYGAVTTAATSTTENTKAFIKRYATNNIFMKLYQDFINSYDLSIRLYTSQIINKEEYTISYQSQIYNIVDIEKKILQDEIIYYDLLVKK
jgi:hypothetical protein